MTRDLVPGPTDEQDADAGEYVLGTLGAEARAEFERLLAVDPALQAAVYAWQDRLLPLARHAEPVAPDAQVWRGLEARLPAVPMAAAPVAESASAPAANDPLWRRLRRWQASSAFGLAASLVLATVLVVRGPLGPRTEPVVAGTRFVAVLEAKDKSTGWVVEATAGGALRLVPVANAEPVPEGKTLQFWTKADGAAGPTSLGLVRPGQVVELPVASLPTLEAHQLFELTLEPAAGSPIGRPTGPVVYIGRTVRI